MIGKMKIKKMFAVLLICTMVSSASFAHGGRTDSSGGHKDNKNASGLGSYHYHHGESAHLHPGGVCPYDKTQEKEEVKDTEVVDENKPVEKETTGTTTEAKSDEIKIKLNDKLLEMENKPVIVDGRTLVPLRVIFEALDLEVGWDGETQTITGTRDDLKIELAIGNKSAKKNNETITIDVAPVIFDSRTFVPVRFIAESTGLKVDWDGETRTVLMNSITE